MEKRTHSDRIKEGIAKKKLKDIKKTLSPLTPTGMGLSQDMCGQMTPQMAAEDSRRNAEFQFRRGLVVAMECILRELR